MKSIVTNAKFNFTRAENDTFLWVDSWNCVVHKSSGRQIYQMHWIGSDGKQTGEVDSETRTQLIAFLDELDGLKAAKPVRQISDDDLDAMIRHEQLMQAMDDPNSDY